MFKSLGVNSLEELQEKLKPPVVETPEQIAQRERQYNAELDAFAIKNNLITKDEIVQLETLKKADPQSVVFSQYAEAYKAKHTDATPEQVSAAFRLAYHLDSETPAFKEHGESLIKNQYDSIVNSLEGKYTTAKDSFHSEVTQRSQMPAFKSFIKSSLDSFVPSKLELVTDGDVKVTLDVDPALRAEIEKELVNNDTFNQFTGSKDAQQLRDAVKAKIEGSLQRRHFEAIKKTIYEAGKAAGMKQGSTTGATHPFPLNTTPVTPVPVEVGITKADDARLANIFG